MNGKTQGCRACVGGSRKLCRNTGTYADWQAHGYTFTTLPAFLQHQCSMLIQLVFLHLLHAYLSSRANCKDDEIIIKSLGKYANRKLYKLREGWENKDNQEHYQHAPGVQALEAWGGASARRGAESPHCSWSDNTFLFMNLLSQAPENSDRWSSNTCDSGER